LGFIPEALKVLQFLSLLLKFLNLKKETIFRLAIGLDYKPCFAMKYIYEDSKGVKLDALCWCVLPAVVRLKIE